MASPNAIVQPTDIVVEKITIFKTHDPEGDGVDITDLVHSIDINEAIYTPTLTGVMLVADGAGLLTELPIVGQEKINFTVVRAGPTGYEKEFSFRVRAIENVTRENDFTNVYQLRLVEEAYFWNALEPISQSFKGSIDTIITEITEQYLRTKITAEKTAGAFQCIIPTWSAYTTMQWLVRRARTEQNDPFFLYNTLHDGMFLSSSRSLYEAEPLNNRTVYTQKESIPKTKAEAEASEAEGVEDKLDMSMVFESVSNTPVTKQLLNGVYGRKYTRVDILNKQIDTLVWNYDEQFDSLPKLSKNSIISDKLKYDDQALASYSRDDIVYAYSSGAFEAPSHMSYNEDVLNTTPFRNAVHQTLGNYVYKLALPGDKSIQVGKVINLFALKNKIVTADTQADVQDKRRSGKHIITAVKHRFYLLKNQYTQMIEINRDTMEVKHNEFN